MAAARWQVEVDETFISSKARNMHIAQRQRRITGTGTKDKTAAMGSFSQQRVRTVVVRTARSMLCKPKSTSTSRLARPLHGRCCRMTGWRTNTYAPQVVDHAVAYVDENVHTNGLENYWAFSSAGWRNLRQR